MPMFMKKSVVIEAILFTEDNRQEIINWSGARGKGMDADGCLFDTHGLRIVTLIGVMWAKPGDWVIKGVAGDFYPCKAEIFDETYVPA